MCDGAENSGISLGRGGGFTALYTAFTIDENGLVVQTESMLGQSKILRTFSIDAALVPRWTRALIDGGFFELDHDRPGNMTEYFELSAEGRHHRVRWQMGAPPPARLAALWREIRQAVEAPA